MSYFCSRSKHVISTIRRLPVLTAIALVVLAVAVCCLIYEYMTESLSYYFTAFFFILLYSVHYCIPYIPGERTIGFIC